MLLFEKATRRGPPTRNASSPDACALRVLARKGEWRDHARNSSLTPRHRENMCLTRSSCGKQHMFSATPLPLGSRPAYRLRSQLQACQAVGLLLVCGVASCLAPLFASTLLRKQLQPWGVVNLAPAGCVCRRLSRRRLPARLLRGATSISLLHKELLEVHQAQQLVITSI